MDIEEWISVFNKDAKYVIWGCTEFTEATIDAVGDIMNIVCIIDKNHTLEKTKFKGVTVHTPDYLSELSRADIDFKVIVSNHFTGTRKEICDYLNKTGFVENVDYSYYEYFISIWSWKYKNKIAASYIEFPVTTRCTLNCKKCAAYIPYVKNKVDRDYNEIINDIDMLFKSIDYIARLRVVGGEPLLYNDLIKLISSICEKYERNIGEFTIVTNGTIIPDARSLNVLKYYSVNLSISDYRAAGLKAASESQYNKLLQILDENGISYHFNSTLRWMDLGNPMIEQKLSDNQLITRYQDCNLDRRSLIKRRVFRCTNIGSAYSAGLNIKFSKEDYLDCGFLNELDKTERFSKWFSFDTLGKTKKGYLDFCKRCNGEGSLNSNFIPVAEQVVRGNVYEQ